MGERERAVVDQLLAASSLQAAEAALLKPDSSYDIGYDVDALMAELATRHDQLAAEGRQPEAELLGFLTDLAQQYRDTIQQVAKLRGRDRTWPTDDPDQAYSPRMALERRVSDLIDQGHLDDALAAARRADQIAVEGSDEWTVVCVARYRLAAALRKASRSREAYEILKDVEFASRSAAAVFDDLLAVQFHTLKGLLHEDMGHYRHGRSSYEAAREAAAQAGDSQAQIHARINVAASYMKSGMYRHAVREFRRTLQFAEFLPDPRAVVAPLSNLGQALQEVGEHEAARSCYQRVLATLDQLGVNSTSRSAAWFGIGDIAHDLGDVQGAVDAYRKGYIGALGTDGARFSLNHLMSRLSANDLPEDNGLFGMVLVFLDMVPGLQDDWLVMTSFRIATAKLLYKRTVATKPSKTCVTCSGRP